MDRKILRLKEMIAYTGLSRSVIYDRMNKKSSRYDETFPKSFPLGGVAIGWLKDEVDAWLIDCSQKAQNENPADRQSSEKSSELKSSASLQGTSSAAPPHRRNSSHIQKSSTTQSGLSNHTVSLGEMIVEGSMINQNLLGYMRLEKWTPVMAALLAAGVNAPLGCTEIPSKGIGLDNRELHASSSRFRDAKTILEKWNWQFDSPQTEVAPHEFLAWCVEDEIDSDWIRLFLELWGVKNSDAVDLTPSRFALLTTRN